MSSLFENPPSPRNLVLVMVHCSMRAKISLRRDSRAGGLAYWVGLPAGLADHVADLLQTGAWVMK